MMPDVPPNCGKCGMCLTVCPVYRQMKEEQASPRARMQLIKAHDEKALNSSPFLKEIISRCLMCGSCSAACPSGIDHYTAFMKMREKMVKDHGEEPAIRSLIYLLARDYRTRIGSRLARTGQKLLPDALARRYNIGNIPVKRLPVLNDTPFRNACAREILPDGPVKGTVTYFTGCATNYLYDDTGFAAVGILKAMGYKVVIPGRQTCCSIPLLFHGAGQSAEKNIQTNIDVLKQIETDHILVDCSTCGEALHKIYPSVFKPSDPLAADAATISQKVTDLLFFVEERLDQLTFNTDPASKVKVAYHAPCHSKNSVWSHAERLIKKLEFVTYRETGDTEMCCGGGGTFFYEYPDISRRMVQSKIENVKAAGVDYWLTDCPVCRMNLSGNLKSDDALEVVHPLTLIHRAMVKNEDPS